MERDRSMLLIAWAAYAVVTDIVPASLLLLLLGWRASPVPANSAKDTSDQLGSAIVIDCAAADREATRAESECYQSVAMPNSTTAAAAAAAAELRSMLTLDVGLAQTPLYRPRTTDAELSDEAAAALVIKNRRDRSGPRHARRSVREAQIETEFATSASTATVGRAGTQPAPIALPSSVSFSRIAASASAHSMLSNTARGEVRRMADPWYTHSAGYAPSRSANLGASNLAGRDGREDVDAADGERDEMQLHEQMKTLSRAMARMVMDASRMSPCDE
jgi:hypothetical protein